VKKRLGKDQFEKYKFSTTKEDEEKEVIQM
jgi:hypothetical protein